MHDERNDRTRRMSRRGFLGGAAAYAVTAGAAGTLPMTALAQEEGAVTKICVFTKHLQFLDYEAMAETAAEIGFDGVDIPVRPGGHVLPERVKDDLPRAVEAVKRNGLDPTMMTTAITGPDSPHAEAVLETGSGLGIGLYRLGYLQYDDAKGVAGSLESFRPQLRDLTAMNMGLGIRGDYQNHAGTNVGAAVWDIWYAIKGLDPRGIGCQYDIRHATVEGGTSWPLGLKLIRPFIGSLVIKDFKWGLADGKWRVVDTPVGEGMVDFKAFFTMVKDLGITAPITMHFEYHYEETRGGAAAIMGKDLAALKSLLAEAGLI
ncbi:MAG: TIM barrel protein [Candidatus Latescibacteria bacterium]|nr:TIM barrel protein [Candidatus Latescibacterota bacterium]